MTLIHYSFNFIFQYVINLIITFIMIMFMSLLVMFKVMVLNQEMEKNQFIMNMIIINREYSFMINVHIYLMIKSFLIIMDFIFFV